MPCRKCDESGCAHCRKNALDVTTRPRFGERAKAATACLISAASRTLTELTSIPTEGATDWNDSELAHPIGHGRILRTPTGSHARRDLLEQFQPFSTQIVFELRKAGSVAAADRVSTKPAPTGSGTTANTIGRIPGSPYTGLKVARPVATMMSGASVASSVDIFANAVGIARAPTGVDPHVAAVGPGRIAQPLQKRRDAGLSVRVVVLAAHRFSMSMRRSRSRPAPAPQAAMSPPRRR